LNSGAVSKAGRKAALSFETAFFQKYFINEAGGIIKWLIFQQN